MIIEILKYLIFSIVIIWFFFELINVIKIIKRVPDELRVARVLVVERYGSKNSVTLRMTLIDKTNKQIKIKADFFTNLRWWKQKIPKVGEEVYFYLLNENLDKRQHKSAYGINTNLPCSKTKKFADLYYNYSINYLLNFTYTLLGLFVI
jgi:hypothetical protein